jgi:xanthine dehydrogenase accessory factor
MSGHAESRTVAELHLQEALSLAIDAQKEGQGAAIVAVVANRGPLPIRPSMRLVVLQSGEVHGSIHPLLDGAAGESARQCLIEKRSRIRSFLWTDDGYGLAGTSGGELDLFIEVLASPPRLVIAGAGHIAVPLAHMGKVLGFTVTVLDDRAAYANRERFPDTDFLCVGPYRETIRNLDTDADTYIVLVTRGHVHDTACLEEVINSQAPYIGMIGSKRRVRTVLEHVREAHPEWTTSERLYAPVGLDIGAQTPEEIALAVLAEIVKVRRGRTGRSLALREALNAR